MEARAFVDQIVLATKVGYNLHLSEFALTIAATY